MAQNREVALVLLLVLMVLTCPSNSNFTRTYGANRGGWGLWSRGSFQELYLGVCTVMWKNDPIMLYVGVFNTWIPLTAFPDSPASWLIFLNIASCLLYAYIPDTRRFFQQHFVSSSDALRAGHLHTPFLASFFQPDPVRLVQVITSIGLLVPLATWHLSHCRVGSGPFAPVTMLYLLGGPLAALGTHLYRTLSNRGRGSVIIDGPSTTLWVMAGMLTAAMDKHAQWENTPIPAFLIPLVYQLLSYYVMMLLDRAAEPVIHVAPFLTGLALSFLLC